MRIKLSEIMRNMEWKTVRLEEEYYWDLTRIAPKNKISRSDVLGMFFRKMFPLFEAGFDNATDPIPATHITSGDAEDE